MFLSSGDFLGVMYNIFWCFIFNFGAPKVTTQVDQGLWKVSLLMNLSKQKILYFRYMQSSLIRTTAKSPICFFKNSSNLDSHWCLILQVWTMAGSWIIPPQKKRKIFKLDVDLQEKDYISLQIISSTDLAWDVKALNPQNSQTIDFFSLFSVLSFENLSPGGS